PTRRSSDLAPISRSNHEEIEMRRAPRFLTKAQYPPPTGKAFPRRFGLQGNNCQHFQTECREAMHLLLGGTPLGRLTKIVLRRNRPTRRWTNIREVFWVDTHGASEMQSLEFAGS